MNVLIPMTITRVKKSMPVMLGSLEGKAVRGCCVFDFRRRVVLIDGESPDRVPRDAHGPRQQSAETKRERESSTPQNV